MKIFKLLQSTVIKYSNISIAVLLSMWITCGFADTNSNTGLQGLASTVTQSFTSIGQLMAATAYLAGFGLTIAAIFKFKQHKDNPAQIPMGTPVAMLVLGVCLIFLPGFIKPAGETIFGTNAGKVAGGYTGSGAAKLTDADQG